MVSAMVHSFFGRIYKDFLEETQKMIRKSHFPSFSEILCF